MQQRMTEIESFRDQRTGSLIGALGIGTCAYL